MSGNTVAVTVRAEPARANNEELRNKVVKWTWTGRDAEMRFGGERCFAQSVGKRRGAGPHGSKTTVFGTSRIQRMEPMASGERYRMCDSDSGLVNGCVAGRTRRARRARRATRAV